MARKGQGSRFRKQIHDIEPGILRDQAGSHVRLQSSWVGLKGFCLHVCIAVALKTFLELGFELSEHSRIACALY
jgi:hypothetical protein